MYHLCMGNELIRRAQAQDLSGMNFIVLARMSNESDRRKRSRDRADGRTAEFTTGLDIDQREVQIARCRAYVESRGGVVVDVYEEPHTSAYKRRKLKDAEGNTIYRVIRPVLQQALNDFKRGVSKSGHRVDGMIAADADRLTRDNRDLEDAIDAVKHTGRPILELSGSLDLLTENGCTNARVIVAFKHGQSADTARRTRSMHEVLQERGIPTGGTRPFGWQQDKRTLHPAEAEAYRQAVADLLEGRPVSAITAEWNRRGITTTRGNKWRPSNFKTMMRNPRAAGYRMVLAPRDPSDPDSPRYPVIKHGPDGKPVIGQWEPMITPERWRALLAVLGEAPQRGSGANTRTYLCAGILRCGKCDHKLRATKSQPSDRKPAGFFWYTCPAVSAGGCGGIKINGPETDEAVTQIVIALWEKEAARRPHGCRMPEAWPGAAELEAVHENMAAAKAARTAGRISAERYYADLGEYEAQERALINDRSAFLRAAAKDASRPIDLRADWASGRFTLADQRAYLERTLAAVIVAPAGRTGKRSPTHQRLTPVPNPEAAS